MVSLVGCSLELRGVFIPVTGCPVPVWSCVVESGCRHHQVPCYHPVKGFKGVSGGISWTPSQAYVDVPMQVPCGRCVGCRLERARQWSVRMMHEARQHPDNCFVTLTYDDARLPADRSLNKKHFQDFMKRLRKSVAPKRISYFHSGEYSDDKWRPHYHAIIFNHDFRDSKFYRFNGRGDRVCTSAELERLWGFGSCFVGAVTFESAGYVARYCLKKVLGDKAADHYRRFAPDSGEIYYLQPEYATMSLKPGIGKAWFEKYSGDLARYDAVAVSGMLTRSPRYYDKLRGKEAMRRVKRKRVFKALEDYENQTDARLKDREEVTNARIKLYLRRDQE